MYKLCVQTPKSSQKNIFSWSENECKLQYESSYSADLVCLRQLWPRCSQKTLFQKERDTLEAKNSCTLCHRNKWYIHRDILYIHKYSYVHNVTHSLSTAPACLSLSVQCKGRFMSIPQYSIQSVKSSGAFSTAHSGELHGRWGWEGPLESLLHMLQPCAKCQRRVQVLPW